MNQRHQAKRGLIFVIAVFAGLAVGTGQAKNPFLAGADPDVLLVDGTVWLYPTNARGSSTQFLAHSSADLQTWTRHRPVLDFKDVSWIYEGGRTDCHAWAPGVATKDGKYYLYFSVGPQSDQHPARIGVAVSDSPAGPFKDSGKPLLTGGNGFEAIDAMVFMDPQSGTPYFYAGGSAGSTLRVFELNDDMLSFAREIPVKTPPHFTEGAYMHYRKGIYYLSYSHGRWRESSYSVHYATAETPVGPWTYRGAILTSGDSHKGPGHHSLFENPGTDDWYIVYHRWNNVRGDGPYRGSRQIAIDRLGYDADGLLKPITMTDEGVGSIAIQKRAAEKAAAAPSVPGTVIHYSPASSGIFIGSPGIASLGNGVYLAKHDEFGPGTSEWQAAITRIYRSDDAGNHWKRIHTVEGLFWASIFTHNDAVYLFGTQKHHGNTVILKSADQGHTWTTPRDADSGLLLEGQYHTAPMPVVIHDGRIWRAMEDAMGGTVWGERYRAFMMSAPVEADLLKRASWTSSNVLARDPAWLDGKFKGWLEGNAVVTPDGGMVDMLRVDVPQGGKAAMVHLSKDGRTATFDPDKDFVDFPCGAKKFTIRFDPVSKQYWSLSNAVPAQHQGKAHAGSIRNTLALVSSPDLRTWQVRSYLLYHPDIQKHGFQYVDWLFEGDDIIAVSRTAYDDGVGGARNFHDANFLTFHRITDFRTQSDMTRVK